MPVSLKSEQVDLLDCIRLALLIKEGRLASSHLLSLAGLAGGFRKMFELSDKTILETVSGPPERIQRLSALLRSGLLRERALQIGEQCRRQKISAVACSDNRYPVNLRQISGFPIVLFSRGREIQSVMAEKTTATIVGTRRPTGYGRLVGRRFSEQLAQAGVLIISGMARGIDTIAHESALAAGMQTLAVLACGLDIVYPPDNAALLDRICEHGTIISEHLPGTPPIRTYFPARNRILSGLADAVIVIEASLKSGSMITASFAADQGRDVFAVPGNVLSRESEGCNRLIAEGAFMLTEVADVLWRLPAARRLDSFTAYLAEAERDDLNNVEEESGSLKTNLVVEEITQLLRGCALTSAELANLMSAPLPEILCNLSELEIQGKVTRDRGKFILKRI
ncbi:MAG: DNA-protecting protein DprA [Ruminococcaceae bacterium]|nr:DNA-protecting protein DprA [Oscillospiraceae bacterium]